MEILNDGTEDMWCHVVRTHSAFGDTLAIGVLIEKGPPGICQICIQTLAGGDHQGRPAQDFPNGNASGTG